VLTTQDRRTACFLFGAAAGVIAAGVAVAARHYPGGFDWAFMVISRLGSRSTNPVGGLWLSASLLAAVCLLWPVAGLIGKAVRGAEGRSSVSVAVLRVGLAGAALLALEGLLGLDLTRLHRKGHEVAAIAAFAGLYGGVLGLYVWRIRASATFLWPALLVLLPLCAVAATQGVLYFDQRELGWVHTGWREMGIPVWLSFAFWQWLAVVFLGVGLGCLLVSRDPLVVRGDETKHREASGSGPR
jgi:hypothetical protein